MLIEANEIKMDESAMTGETDAIKKDTMEGCMEIRNSYSEKELFELNNAHKIPSPIILSGTEVHAGEGKMIVTVVGKYSCSGKIQAALALEDADEGGTPLQQKLEVIAEDIGKFGLVGASVTFIALTIQWTIR